MQTASVMTNLYKKYAYLQLSPRIAPFEAQIGEKLISDRNSGLDRIYWIFVLPSDFDEIWYLYVNFNDKSIAIIKIYVFQIIWLIFIYTIGPKWAKTRKNFFLSDFDEIGPGPHYQGVRGPPGLKYYIAWLNGPLGWFLAKK